ncbi:TetR/AcrR family transcriptional regulator [Plastoroseomonas hellenica]|uniref:TetR/AcrR family transcriptional regulator n=1 Tax=Plastoroseomonas hellenica TaxID=2687306 RepID=UPI001BA627AC|nr:TetR/AcrR family transcriptional regulator [Plastoroseomonas hellenica]MBR0643152.1 TetR/AcrR family transcriptional regulator [Plastoroseomonas hellenica]
MTTSTPRGTYHHGDLRRAMIAEAIRLIEAEGLEKVTLREVARRLGVSSGAPFRHVPSRMALLTLVAEEAMERLQAEIAAALEGVSAPLERFRATGHGFLRWAIRNPAHFQVISARGLIDFEGSGLRRANDVLRAMMADQLAEAAAQGMLGDAPEQVLITGRALAYGLARMHLDGQFPSWGLDPAAAEQVAIAAIDRYIDLVTVRP